ncbi:MAG: ABC-ATPase domain-containing protein [Fusicatenibacter sp.]|nr:ABC-ATPase domain-containing protein [Fusicatenibacter sp.]
MQTANELRKLLTDINHKSYPAYKSLRGLYQFPGYVLSIDHVQGDPFAAPSRVSIHLDGKTAGFPKNLYDTRPKRIALQDYLLRLFARAIEPYSFQAKGSGKSGLLGVSRCGQEILERTACSLNPQNGALILNMEVGFPANGRSIQSQELAKILYDFLPGCVEKTLYYRRLNPADCTRVAQLCEDQQAIRQELKKRHLTAFVANGAILPRESGISDKPMRRAVPFASPSSLEVTMELPNRGPIRGMGIPEGITLIVGGGFHGKSTLLHALELGVYDHIAGDGRELVITDSTAVKLRSEDSRSISNTDISLFINDLPNKGNTKAFSTADASGSTSQAANVVEGIEAGTSLFLIDEDTSATNFMIRDELMQRVVSDSEEPITPFISRVRDLSWHLGISSILVAGSSGSYFHVADTIIQMKEYIPYDITGKAKKEASAFPAFSYALRPFVSPVFERRPVPDRTLKDQDRLRIKAMGRESIMVQKSVTDLRYVEQLVDSEQLHALAVLLCEAAAKYMDGHRTLLQIVDLLEQQMDTHGLSSLKASGNCDLARPRRQEIFACLNRCRNLKF